MDDFFVISNKYAAESILGRVRVAASSFRLCVFAPFAILHTKYAFELLKSVFAAAKFHGHSASIQGRLNRVDFFFFCFVAACGIRIGRALQLTRIVWVCRRRANVLPTNALLQFRLLLSFYSIPVRPFIILYLFEIIYLPIFVPYAIQAQNASFSSISFISSYQPFHSP